MDRLWLDGGQYAVFLALLAGFGALDCILALVGWARSRGGFRRWYGGLFGFGVLLVAAVAARFGRPYLPLHAAGCLSGCGLLHVLVFAQERREVRLKDRRARGYRSRLEAEHAANRAQSLFFSSVSHDIRTPLNAIAGFSELLERGAGSEMERARYVSSIRSSARVLARLVDDILDLSKLESGKLEIIPEPTDVPALVREVAAACEVARARKPLALHTQTDPMPRLEVDPQRIRQILYNLLSNACKHTDRGDITVRALWRDGTLSLAVADTGRGIPEEDIPRILEPFVQLTDRNHREGTGLGLPICRKLAALMGGELKVESEVGVGSTFTVTLPGVRTAGEPPAAAAATERAERPERPFRAPSRVLVADDSSVNRAVLKAMLENSGVSTVALAADGRAALALLKGGGPYDLVLTDLRMPVLDGRGLVRAIRADAALARLPVYLVTADVDSRAAAAEDGFTGILLKPLTLDRLRALFARGNGASPA